MLNRPDPAEHTFHTQRKPGSSFIFTMQADSHLDQMTRPVIYDRARATPLRIGRTSTSTWVTPS
jgi:hypothetical protein